MDVQNEFLPSICQSVLEEKRFENQGHIHLHVNSPGTGARKQPGVQMFSIWSFAVRLLLSPYKCIETKVDHGVNRSKSTKGLINLINFVEFESYNSHAKISILLDLWF